MARTDKSDWPDGPWHGEPDYERFEQASLPCVIVRGPMGQLNGYVGVPEGHPLHGKDYSDRIKWNRDDVRFRGETGSAIDFLLEACRDDDGTVAVTMLLQPHGGVTYAADHAPQTESDGLWWFGFDCAHAGDLCPQMSRYCAPDDTYRDIEYARAECRRLADALAEFRPA